MDGALFLSVLVFALTAQAVYLISPAAPTSQVVRRLNAYKLPSWQGGLTNEFSVLRRKQYSRIPWLDAFLQRFDLADKLGTELRRAGLPLRAGEFFFLQLVVATLLAFVGLLALGGTYGGLLAPGVGAILGFLAPLPWLRAKRLARTGRFEKDLPDALDLVAGSLKAGYGLSHGLDLVSKEFEGPCAQEFAQLLEELNLGADLDVCLARMVDRVDSEDARLLATAVAVQRRTGGNLIEVLGRMTDTIRERLRLRNEVRVITTAPRISGYFVALLPLFTMVGMFFTSRYYLDVLLSEPLGHAALAVGTVLVLLGLYANHRIAQVDY